MIAALDVGYGEETGRYRGAAVFFETWASARPLHERTVTGQTPAPYRSAAGIELDQAAQAVAGMHGAHRVPTLLRWVDGRTRQAG